ncbi:MAG: acetoin dehydrogenase dihydrolipoyllysine-residue acetyltransferase subunit [Emcibacter sp.]|nr:acetoin dehydrogenase dihydrolipoyllysine-residue acetyltransferase subunit [Emcibacter sp.]
MTDKITPLLLPKWGMDMAEGKIGEWLVSEGAPITAGTELLEIESEKITNVLDAAVDGILRCRLVNPEDIHPVGTLLGVIAGEDVSDSEISDFIAGYQSDMTAGKVSAAMTADQIDDILEVHGQGIHYTDSGAGKATVVLIHGFGGSLASWGGLQSALAATYRVISLELPGHGTSSKQINEEDVRAFARLLLDFLEGLGIEEAYLVGHSLGGEIAALMAGLAPSRINSLTLISSYGGATKVDIGYIDDFLTATRRKEVKAVLKRLFVDQALVNNDMIESLLKSRRLEGADQALRRIADMIKAGKMAKSSAPLPAIPAQVIIGRGDNIITVDDVVLAEITNLSFVEGAGHMPQLEKAAETTALIKDFINKNSKAGSPPLSEQAEHGL